MTRTALFLFFYAALIFSGCTRKNETDKHTITQDSLVSNTTNELPPLTEILFVGLVNNKAGLYKYNISNKAFQEFWSNANGEIFELSYSPDKKFVFMLTARQTGKRGVFPFIDNVKLYSINVDSDSIKFIESIGSGLQVFTSWKDDNSFKVVLNVMNVQSGVYIDQKIKTCTASGDKLSDEHKKYDLAKDGYPQITKTEEKTSSPDKKYTLQIIDSVQTEIYLTDHSTKDGRVLITKQNQKLNNVDWSDDGKHLVFSIIDISAGNETLYDPEPNTAKLFIYSIEGKRIVKIFEGSGIKNFMLNGDYLLFDDGFKNKSKIFIYNLSLERTIDSIKISGGCGLKNIPLIPDYEA